MKKILVWCVLAVLLISPFINWRFGAFAWLFAWTVFVIRSAFNRKTPKKDSSDDKTEDQRMK